MWLLPSLNRAANLRRFLDAFRATGGSTPGAIIADHADFAANRAAYESLDLPRGWFIWQTAGVTPGDKLREIWDRLAPCTWLGLIGDDCVPETAEWDKHLITSLDGTNFVSCDDARLAPHKVGNCWAISGGLVRTVGYIFPPGLQHLFVDDVWETLGRATGCWRVRMDVRVRHAAVTKAMRRLTIRIGKSMARALRRRTPALIGTPGCGPQTRRLSRAGARRRCRT
jgi:hypothetical protein